MQNRKVTRSASNTAVLACLLAATVFLAGSWQAGAQTSSTVQGSRGFAPSGALVRLAGHTPPQVLEGTAMRVGHYDPEQKLRLVLAVQRPHPAEEEQFIKELTTIGSPQFRQFLTAEEWNARFAPSVEDEQKIVDWAQSQGLTVTNRFANRLLVDVEAPAGAIEKVFGVTIDNYQVGDEVDFSNDRDPQLPASLSGIVTSVLGLNSIQRAHRSGTGSRAKKGPDYVPGPVHVEARSSQGDGDPSKAPSNQSSPMARDSSSPRPNMKDTSWAGWLIEPGDIQGSQAYNYSALSALGHCCNPHGDSTGSPPDSSIGLASFGGFNDSDVQAFFKHFGMAYKYDVYAIDGANPPPGAKCTKDCTLNGDDGEGPLDLEYSTAMANSYGAAKDTAHVYVYEGVNNLCSTIADVYNFMLSDGHAKVLSTSYGWEESGLFKGCGDKDTMHGIFNSMTGAGWTLVAAAGDDGSTDICDSKKDTATVSVDYPGSDPNFVSVGGTRLDLDSSGKYVSEITWNSGGSPGCWGAGGGGVSREFSQPSWQSGLTYLESIAGQEWVVSGSTMRLVPDISLNAGAGQYYYDGGQWDSVYGTSIGAPELAGFFAQENAYLASIGSICGAKGTSACEPIGNPNPMIYYEGIHKNAAHDPFYDTTQDCNYSGTGLALGLTEYCATTGWDAATGWGTANMLQLAWAINWEVIPASGIPYITFSGPATNTWYHTNQTVNWKIHDYVPTGGTPGVGIAGFTQGWDSIPGDAGSEPHGGSGNSFYSGPEFPNATKGWLSLEGANGSGQGCHSVHVRGWNNQGWTTAGQSSFPGVYGPICYDTVSPTITVSNNPAMPTSGWYKVPVTITVTATDPGGKNASGVAAIYTGWTTGSTSGCKPGSTSTCQPYGGAFSIGSQGTQTLNAFSEDHAGNFSSEATETIRIDTVAPVTTASYTPTPGSSGWDNTAATVTLSATDNLSGIAETYYWLDNPNCSLEPFKGFAKCLTYTAPFSISSTGKHTVYFQSVDKADNVEAVKNMAVDVDVTPPVTVATPSPAPNSKGWNKSTVTVSLSATDVGSGVAKTVYWLDNSSCVNEPVKGKVWCQTYTAPFSISTAGKHAVYFNSIDKAGNVETTKTLAVNIDEVAPVTKATLGGVQEGSFFESAVTVTLTAADSLSGVQATYYSLDGGATATYSTPFVVPTAGSHTLKFWSVDLAGNTETANSDSFAIASPTSTALTASPNPAVNGQSVTLTATVAPAPTITSKPTGTVTFQDGTAKIGTGTLSGGVATLTTAFTTTGQHALTAIYAGVTGQFIASTSKALAETVKETTSTTVAPSANPANYGQPVTLTATVKPSISGVPTGTVQFMDGATALGTETLNSSGVASLPIAKLAAGSHSITAVYSGDSTYITSTSALLKETINQVASATALKSSIGSSSFDESVTFTATVTSAGGTPAGTVTFLADGTSIGTGTLSNGVATLATSQLPVKANSITASYAGNTDFKSSTSTALSFVTSAAATTTQVGSSLNPSTVGASVTFTATVKSATAGTPSGTATFKDGTTSLGTGTLSNGTATLTTKTLASGKHSITAVYGGSTDYVTSTSTALTQAVNPAATTPRVVILPYK